MEPIQAVASQNILGEGPLWNVKEQAIYWVDIDGKKIQCFYPHTKKLESFDVPKKVCVLAFREKGGLVVAAEDGFYFWDSHTQNMDFIAHPETGKTASRFNDGKVDRKGRFWAGTMTATDATSSLYRLDTDLNVHLMEAGTTISNGVGWSPDNRSMYFVDSMRYVVNQYDFDLDSGSISRRRVFAQLDEKAGIPDGLTVDSEGYVWLAVYGGWKVLRYDPAGRIVAKIQMPVSQPSSCIFGGDDLMDLYIPSISTGLSEEQKAREPMAGDLFVVHTDVKGLPEPDFAG